ncbi:MAG: DoxX family membrane protein [Candidatus Dormibacteraeota bacterium]|nr:DoxX family membrane protein [Candidatus Dormibacteraeota bacterium]
MRLPELWRGVFRIVVGIFWLYFASQKWGGVGWMRPLIQDAPSVNPIPGLHELLAVVVAPNWLLFAVAQAVAETVVGVLLVLGLGTRKVAVLGLLLALNLALVVAFEAHDIGSRWLYYLAVLVNAELIFADEGWPALGGYRFVPAWLRS